MKLVAIVGSLRKNSYNRSIFRFYQTLLSNGVTIEEVSFADFPLLNEDLEVSQFPESVTRQGELIRSADGILFFTPEYNSSIPGGLKNAIDWISRVDTSPFAGKPAAILSASPGKLGGARMQPHLRQVGAALDIQFMNRPEILISTAHEQINESGELINESTQKFLRKHYASFVAFVEKFRGAK